MKIIVIGATGTIGAAVADALSERHEVIGLSRRSEPAIDVGDPSSVARAFAAIPGVDAVVCCAASTPLLPFGSDESFRQNIERKLFGQIDLVRQSAAHIRDGGSVTITSGAIPDGLEGAAGGALTNAGLEAFARAVAPELPRGIRLNAVSPGWVQESLDAAGMSGAGTPAAVVAESYVAAVAGTDTGTTIRP